MIGLLGLLAAVAAPLNENGTYRVHTGQARGPLGQANRTGSKIALPGQKGPTQKGSCYSLCSSSDSLMW